MGVLGVLEKKVNKNYKVKIEDYELNEFTIAQKLAAFAILKPDFHYYVRKVFRYYSETWSTPLHEVYNLPIDFVLQHFFENVLETEMRSKNDDEWIDILKNIVESIAETKERLLAEKQSNAEDEEFLKKAEQEAEQKEGEEAEDFSPPPIVMNFKEIQEKLDKISGAIKNADIWDWDPLGDQVDE